MALRLGLARAGRIFAGAGAVGLLVGGLGAGGLSAGSAFAHSAATQLNLNFVLVSKGGKSAPTTLIAQQSPHGPKITISVPTSCPVLRRYYGNSSLEELSIGDHLLVSGGWAGSRSFDAVGIVDQSIQVGYSQINAKVTYLGRGYHKLAVQVTANQGKDAAFAVQATVTVDVAPTMKVDLLGNHHATIANLRPGMELTFWGLSNRDAHLVAAPRDITQILVNGAAKLTKVAPADGTSL